MAVNLARTVEEIFAHLERKSAHGLGGLARDQLGPMGEEIDAALSVLLLDGRVRKGEDDFYYVPDASWSPALDTVIQEALAQTNPHILNAMAKDPAVISAVRDFFRRAPLALSRDIEQDIGFFDGGLGRGRAPRRVRYSTPRLDIDYHVDGRVRIVAAR